MPINRSEVESAMEANGFLRTHTTKKVIEYRSMHNGKYIYFRTDIGLPEYIRLVVDPREPIDSLVAIAGVKINPLKELQHGSNMAQFPKRKHEGTNEIHYGKALNIIFVSALTPFAEAFHKLPVR